MGLESETSRNRDAFVTRFDLCSGKIQIFLITHVNQFLKICPITDQNRHQTKLILLVIIAKIIWNGHGQLVSKTRNKIISTEQIYNLEMDSKFIILKGWFLWLCRSFTRCKLFNRSRSETRRNYKDCASLACQDWCCNWRDDLGNYNANQWVKNW